MQKNWCVFFIFLIILACSKPNNIGLEIQPSSDIIKINQSNNLLFLDINTILQDSINSDRIRPNLIIGENHTIFGEHNASIATQILLSSNNIDLGNINDLVIEDVYLTYDCYDYYPNTNELDTNLEFSVFELDEDLNSDSIYFSNTSFNYLIENLCLNANIIDADTGSNPAWFDTGFADIAGLMNFRFEDLNLPYFDKTFVFDTSGTTLTPTGGNSTGATSGSQTIVSTDKIKLASGASSTDDAYGTC